MSAPPPGMPDMSDTSTQQGPIIAAFTVMLLLATFTVVLRFYTRWRILNVIGTEDWLIVAALVFSIGVTIGFVRQSSFALGHHIWTVTPEIMSATQKEQWYTFLLYILSLATTKISILLLYLRILQHGYLRTANYVLLGVVMLCNIWVVITQCIACIPLQALWDPRVHGWCLGINVQQGNAILHVITDFAIFSLPLPVVAKLKMHRKQKAGLYLVFAIGFVVCIISIIRIVSLSKLGQSTDITWDLAALAYWGAVEVNLAIICASLTTLKPLLVKLFPKMLGSSSHSRFTASYGTAGPGVSLASQNRVNPQKRAFSKLDEVPDNNSATSEDASPTFVMCDLEGQASARTDVATPTKSYVGQGLGSGSWR